MVEYERVQAIVDLGIIKNNVERLKKLVNPSSKIMLIIKADGYGHGAEAIVNYLGDTVDAYGVAMIDEAIKLREYGCTKMILTLGYTPSKYLSMIVKYDISQTVFEYETAKLLSDVAVSQGKTAKIHIKLDTGMGRIGFSCNEESIETIKKISELPGIVMEGCFTHFSKADESRMDFTEKQFSKYMDFVSKLEAEGITFNIRHACNSAGVIQFPKANLDMVRLGIAAYGLYPSEDIDKDSVYLEPAMQIRSVISYVKEVEKGTMISYNGTYIAPDRRVIATIPIGYADGYPRAQSNTGRVIINGQYAPIVGRVCMDQIMVDVTDIPGVKREDIVTLVGKDGDKFIGAEEVAISSNSFNYEFVCNVGKRVPRRYIK